MRSRRQGGRGLVPAAGEVVSVPPPDGPSAIPLSQAIAKACADSPEFAAAYAKANAPAVNCVYDVWGADFGVQAGARCVNADPVHQGVHHSDPPAPVPPPVDALLKLIDEFGDARHDVGLLVGGPSETSDETEEVAVRLAAAINAAVNGLWAAGVEEGRRQRDAEIHAEVLASAREVAAEAGFGPAPESVTVSYVAAGPVAAAFARGVAEGRRQATEERTEVERG
jgi:hypothetical protein